MTLRSQFDGHKEMKDLDTKIMLGKASFEV